MTHRAQLAARWWTVLPPHQVTFLIGTDPELLRIALDPLPPDAPAVLQFRPATGDPLGNQIDILLSELDSAAVALFPRWLPGAERLDRSIGLGAPAVRSLAAEAAARSTSFGPFLIDLAERGLLGRTGGSHLPAEVQAAGLARVIADAYERTSSALLIEVPDGLSPTDEFVLAATAEWFARYGFTVWLAGAPLQAVDRIQAVSVALPRYLTELAAEAEPEPTAEPEIHLGQGPLFSYPPVSGQPAHNSPAEQTLERALAHHEWATGRRWNYTFEGHLLSKLYRLDLFWADEGLVVEVDGNEHRDRFKFADDRHRDVQLQLLGHVVLRFTNEQVLSDTGAAVAKIRQLLERRRADVRAMWR